MLRRWPPFEEPKKQAAVAHFNQSSPPVLAAGRPQAPHVQEADSDTDAVKGKKKLTERGRPRTEAVGLEARRQLEGRYQAVAKIETSYWWLAENLNFFKVAYLRSPPVDS